MFFDQKVVPSRNAVGMVCKFCKIKYPSTHFCLNRKHAKMMKNMINSQQVNLLTRILGAVRDFIRPESYLCSMFRGDTSTLPKESHQKHAFLSRQNCLNTHFQTIGICEYCLDISSKQCDQNCSLNKFTGKNRRNVQEKMKKVQKQVQKKVHSTSTSRFSISSSKFVA